MGSEMSERTVGGLLAYCDWLRDKGYQSPNAVEAWKTAAKKIFEAVEPETYEAIALEDLDLADYIRRFRVKAAKQYKAETITVYERRLVRAITAHEYYLANGKPPAFRSGQRTKDDGEAAPSSQKPARKTTDGQPRTTTGATPAPERYEFSYPMSYGMAHISVPIRMTKRDIDRLTTVLSTLEEQPQIPEHTGARLAA